MFLYRQDVVLQPDAKIKIAFDVVNIDNSENNTVYDFVMKDDRNDVNILHNVTLTIEGLFY